MKIAVLGNMNNNGFALMRYLRDIGEEADLLLFDDDEDNYSSHFSLKADTWHLEKWKKYVKKIPITNSYAVPLQKKFFFKIILYFTFFYRRIFGLDNYFLSKPASNSSLQIFKEIIDEYDVLFGSGAMPAILNSLNRKLTVFMAYSMGVEYLEEKFFLKKLKSRNLLVRLLAHETLKEQKAGIKNTILVINTEFTATERAYKNIGVKTATCQIPVVYFEESNPKAYSDQLKNALEKINSFEFNIISHVRQQWIKPSNFRENEWRKISKNNDWLIKSYKDFLEKHNYPNCNLVLFEYGEDFNETKKLANSLSISEYITWLPRMSRKEIIVLLKNCSIGIGEFYEEGVIWGGAGWEIIGSGIPLIQKFSSENKKTYTKKFQFPAPQIISVDNITSLTKAISDLYKDKNLCNERGSQLKKWFDEFNSYNTVHQLINLIDSK